MTTKHDSETWVEQLSRVRLMADGEPTWDLSDNDIAALKAVLANRDALSEALKLVLDAQSIEHDDGCPEDDTCQCDLVRIVNDALSDSFSPPRVSRAGAPQE